MRERTLFSEVLLNRPLDEVFPFFAAPENLNALTPPWLHFRILTPTPIPMRVGQTIAYSIRVRGIPMRWLSRITAFDPPRRFVDEQVRGPYALWRHEHLFEALGRRTRCIDRVAYRIPLDVPLNPVSAVVHRLLVRPELERIFAFRRGAMLERFAPHDGGAAQP
ncbi:MAG: SRPBCC family protein [Phycisphaerae bacterium]|nr:SRPBCC family protein [Phycisphaerae bacterium]